MNATTATPGIAPLGALSAPAGPGRTASRRATRWLAAGVLGLLLPGGLALAAMGPRIGTEHEPSLIAANRGAEAPMGLATMPSEPVDGVLSMVIPPGAAADQQAGGRGYEMPSVISLNAGDTMVIRNDDDAPHMILYTFLEPGETDTRIFTEPGSEVYSAGCGLHAASFLNFTTIFVSEPGAASGSGSV